MLTEVENPEPYEYELELDTLTASQLFERMGIGLVIIDAETHRIVRTNETARQLIGLSGEEIVNKVCHNFICPADRGKCPISDLHQSVDKSRRILLSSSGKEVPILKTIEQVIIGERLYYLESFLDISDEVSREHLLREKEVRFRHLFDNISSGVAVYEAVDNGEDFIFRDFNRKAEQIDRIDRSDVLGRRIGEIFPGIAAFGLLDVCKRVYKTGEPESFPVSRYEDERIAGWRNNYIYRLPNGEIVAVYDDETEAVETARKLRESEELYRNVVDNIGTGIALISPDMEILTMNLQMQKWFPEIDVTCKPVCYKTFHTPSREQPCEHCPTILTLRNGTIHTAITENHDGHTTRYYRIISSPLRDETGKVQSVIELVDDITEHKVMERTLRENEEKFRTIASNAHDAIIMIDHTGRVTFWNDAAEKIFDRAAEEMLGKDVHEFLVPVRYMDQFRQAFPSFQKTGTGSAIGKVLELLAMKKDGTEFPIEITLSAVTMRGKWNSIAVIRDITERKQFQKELEYALERAESASKAKSSFLANMSHEIRTPMNGVIGMTELLLNTTLKREQKEYVETIKKSADSLLHIINDILDFSKIEAGKLELESTEFDLVLTIDELSSLYALKTEDKGLEFNLYISSKVPKRLLGDSVRLKQVLHNLLGNAVKFTQSGDIFLSIQPQKIENEMVTLRFSVKDSGIGIPSDKIDHLFHAFSQADPSVTRKYGGTGLGLSIAKALVELMGGKLNLSSGPEKGSVFWFDIPFSIKGDVNSDTLDKKIASVSGKKALIVDKNMYSQQSVSELLLSWGCLYVTCDDVRKARKIMQESVSGNIPFDFVFIDESIQGEQRYDLVNEINLLPELAGISIVVFSSFSQTSIVRELYGDKIAACISKPVKRSTLFDSLMAILNVDRGSAATSDQGTSGQNQRPGLADKKLHLLLAEDNPVNQAVTKIMLSKFGHTVDIVWNGREAISLLKKKAFDLVLMDVQMPELDGLTATRLIRQKTEEVLDHQIPIIAMTAHAMKGDREKCIEAGMTDYISKPIKMDVLQAIIEKCSAMNTTNDRKEGKIAESKTVTDASVAFPVFEASRLEALFSLDTSGFNEFLGLFCDEMISQLELLKNAFTDHDIENIEFYSHKIKGAAGDVGGMALRKLSEKVEHAARKRDINTCLALEDQFEPQAKALIDALKSYQT